jgi:hypothetical protein
MGQAHLVTAFPARPTEPFGRRPKQGSTEVLDSGAVRWGRVSERWPVRWGTRFGHWRKRRLMRGWCPQGRSSTRGEQWWGAVAGGGGQRLTAREGGRDMGGHWGRHRRNVSVAGGGWYRWHLHGRNGQRLSSGSLEDEAPLERRWGR